MPAVWARQALTRNARCLSCARTWAQRWPIRGEQDLSRSLQWVNSIRDRAPNIDFGPAQRDGRHCDRLVIQAQLLARTKGILKMMEPDEDIAPAANEADQPKGKRWI